MLPHPLTKKSEPSFPDWIRSPGQESQFDPGPPCTNKNEPNKNETNSHVCVSLNIPTEKRKRYVPKTGSGHTQPTYKLNARTVLCAFPIIIRSKQTHFHREFRPILDLFCPKNYKCIVEGETRPFFAALTGSSSPCGFGCSIHWQ